MSAITAVCPWGEVIEARPIAEGLEWVFTASHGGIHVSSDLLKRMRVQETPYSRGGFFEEDIDWSLVAVSFPDKFTGPDVQAAEDILKSAYDGKYRELLGVETKEEHQLRLFADLWRAGAVAFADGLSEH